MNTEKLNPQIIYIMGTGRSGTTILEIILSEAENVYGLGEVTRVFHEGLLEKKVCSCGQDVWHCPVWKKILDKYLYYGNERITDVLKLFKKNEHHSFFLINYLAFNKGYEDSYKSINYEIFNNAKEVTGKNVFVDASKYPGRILSLGKTLSNKIYIVCMTRRPEGLIKAFQKKNAGEQKSKNLVQIFMYYTFVLLCCRMVLWKYPQQSICIRYEDLCSYPLGVLKKIEDLTKVSFRTSISKIKKNDTFEIQHILTGNRIRYNNSVRFQPQLKIPVCEGLKEKLTCSLMKFVCKILRF